MNRRFLTKNATALFIFLLCHSGIFAQNKQPAKQPPDSSAQPTLASSIVLLSAGTISLGIELAKNRLGPFSPYVIQPTALDVAFRQALLWGSPSLAATTSDITLGLLASGLIWLPFLLDRPYFNGLYVLAESFIYVNFFTQLIKVTAGRLRPYAFYGTASSAGVDDNYSFLSGHTSFAFALATTASLMLAERFPHLKALIYFVSYLLAASTAYLRIAADRHYFTDVFAGALLGSTVGYVVYQWRKPWLEIQPYERGLALRKTVRF